MVIFQVSTNQQLDILKILFKEYFDWIAHELKVDMSYQNIEKELLSLPGAFSPPAGSLLIAEFDGQAAGCIALRPLSQTICEMKRMFVRPEFRGRGLGRALCERLISEAKSKNYQLMRLDTEISLIPAQKLYLSLGFKIVQAYYDVPAEILKRSIFMERSLQV